MKTQQLYIPERLKVGFKPDESTYTKKLAFVIYFDHTGKLKREGSWETWRDKKFDPVEYDNKPRRGFVLNKGVGGVRQSFSRYTRQEYVRVYDPRDFEFEITVPNLLFILKECDCSRGKGLEGEFAYAWEGQSLILLPVKSADYKSCIGFTKLQAKSVTVSELIPGATYLTRKEEQRIYLGRFDYYHGLQMGRDSLRRRKMTIGKERFHVLYDPDTKHQYQRWLFQKDVKNLATLASAKVVSNYAELVDTYNKSINGSPPVRLYLEDIPPSEPGSAPDPNWHIEESPGVYAYWQNRGSPIQPWITAAILCHGRIWLDTATGVLCREHCQRHAMKAGVAYRDVFGWGWGNQDQGQVPWIESTGKKLWVELASGARFEANYYPYH